jgi:DNA-binding XRE family transcriptional regulator
MSGLPRPDQSGYPDNASIRMNVGITRNPVILVQCLDMETPSQTDASQPFRIYTPESLGQAIRHFRREAGLTQDELAKRAGLNRTYLSDLERAKETEQVRRILHVLRQLGARMTVEKADW